MIDMVISDETVNRIMGMDPIPQLDIEMDEIQNELQRKMAEEIHCTMCGNFPYQPQECKNCNKLFCKYCQLQLK
jgi:predicted nucleic acid binding AN1-type Zn finger protein